MRAKKSAQATVSFFQPLSVKVNTSFIASCINGLLIAALTNKVNAKIPLIMGDFQRR